MTSRTLTFALALAGATACGMDIETPEVARAYYADPCGRGDPVSRMCPMGETTLELADPTFALCSAQAISEGDSCAREGDRCVLLPAQACSANPTQSINSAAYLTCRSEPFPANPSCPMSSARVKKDILHIDGSARAQIAHTMLETKLAKYAYTSAATGDAAPQLGFIIEELSEEAPYVLRSDGEHVNVYGYASAILATVQEQQRQIEELSAQVESLKRECR